MRRLFSTVTDAIGPMRYGSKGEVSLYWFIRIGSIAVPVLLFFAILGLVYAKVKGIEIKFF